MDGVSIRIKDGRDVPIDVIRMMLDVGHGKRDVFSKGTRTVHTNPLGVGTKMTATGHAVATTTTDDVPFNHSDNITFSGLISGNGTRQNYSHSRQCLSWRHDDFQRHSSTG